MREILLLLSIFLLESPFMVSAQENRHVDNHHSHYKNEVAISNNLVFLGLEKELAFGIHFHYLRSIGETKFSSGLGYERVFDEHRHNTISLAGSYRPFHELVLLVSPGIAFEDQMYRQIELAIHIEAGYEIEIKHFHLGPFLGFAFIPGDYHVSLGLHLGYGF